MARTITSSAVSDIVTLVAYTQGVLDSTDLLRAFLIVFTLAQILSQTFWQPSGLAPAIETRTSRR
jgi:hypothetical protein